MPQKNPTALARESTGNRQGDAIQEAARRQSRASNVNPINNGLTVGPVAFAAGVAKDVAHGLDRAWRGWFVTDGDTIPQATRGAQTDRTKFVTLSFAADCNLTLWVF